MHTDMQIPVNTKTTIRSVYLKQHGLKIYGIGVDLTKRVLSHARGATTRDIREDEEFDNSCEDDITFDPESTDSAGGITYVKRR